MKRAQRVWATVRSRGRISRALAAGIVLICVISMVGAVWYGVKYPQVSDFVYFYAAGSVQANGGDVYDAGQMERASNRAVREYPGFERRQRFVYPPQVAEIFAPLSKLPLRAAAAIYAVVSCAVLAFTYLLLRRLTGGSAIASVVVVLALTSPAAVLALRVGQFDIFPLLSVAAGLLLAAKERPAWAGAIVGVGLLKWSTVWMIPLTLALVSRRAFAGMMACAAALYVTGIPISGIGWPLRAVHELTLSSDNFLNSTAGLPEIFVNNVDGLAGQVATAALVVTCAAIIFAFRKRLQGDLVGAIALGTALSIVTSNHAQLYEFVMLAAPLSVVALHRPRLAAGVSLSAWLYDLAALDGPAWVHNLDSRTALSTLLYVPIISALLRGRPRSACVEDAWPRPIGHDRNA